MHQNYARWAARLVTVKEQIIGFFVLIFINSASVYGRANSYYPDEQSCTDTRNLGAPLTTTLNNDGKRI
ncbi:hypothetical protein EFY79_14150 [Hanamia caeni]|uniref:Uncharacterized protein n=1 Tax=Hanamia caeni TaxID=2294116 RepID=A0A3M9NBR1_9BACT|nr:hypothetical protein EFY79_14150 [Hanamia caeni]